VIDLPQKSSTSGSKDATTTSETTKTDSGITHTIPNSSVVTVTRHTVVFSEAPRPSATSLVQSGSIGTTPTTSCSDCLAPSTTTDADAAGDGGGISTGAIAGIASSGVVAIALMAVIWMVTRNRRRRRRDSSASGDEDVAESMRIDGFEKITPHTTGTDATSVDPFAPFGGILRLSTSVQDV
jgi:hypothetical protein